MTALRQQRRWRGNQFSLVRISITVLARRMIRRGVTGAAALFLTAHPSSLAFPKSQQLPGPVFAAVERVVDGDTLAVRARIWLDQELRVYVRIAQIDTPEIAARCARERQMAARAREFVNNILYTDGISEPAIWLTDINQDKFGGRVLARVTVSSGADIAQALVQAGLAYRYNGGKRVDWCQGFKF